MKQVRIRASSIYLPLLDSGVISLEEYARQWEIKWGDTICDPWSLMTHTGLDEICFFADVDDARDLAVRMNGCVYAADVPDEEIVINNEGVPSVVGRSVDVVALK